jgi:hypothetical protein
VYFASKADELMTHMSSEFTEAANPNRTSASNFTTPNLFDRDTFNQRPQQGTEVRTFISHSFSVKSPLRATSHHGEHYRKDQGVSKMPKIFNMPSIDTPQDRGGDGEDAESVFILLMVTVIY